MVTDPNINAKITFSHNNTQLKNTCDLFMTKSPVADNSYVAQSDIAINRNLYIALVIPVAKKLPVSVEQYKA